MRRQQDAQDAVGRAAASDPSKITAFDRGMRGLIQVPKAEPDARVKREAQQKRPKKE